MSNKKYHPNATDPYEYEDLEELWNYSLQEKISWSKDLLRKELDKSENSVVSFSGGKSSQVALHLALKIDSGADVVHNDTGVMYPETGKFVEELAEKWGFKDNLVVTEPEKDFWEVVEENGWPSYREGDGEPRCCFWLKTRPMRELVKENDYDLIVTGEQADESSTRRVSFLQYGGSFQYRKWGIDNLRKAKPLSIWRDVDIWEYIEENDLIFNPVYEKYEIQRTGCVTCTAFQGWEKKMRKYSEDLYKRIKKEKDGDIVF